MLELVEYCSFHYGSVFTGMNEACRWSEGSHLVFYLRTMLSCSLPRSSYLRRLFETFVHLPASALDREEEKAWE